MANQRKGRSDKTTSDSNEETETKKSVSPADKGYISSISPPFPMIKPPTSRLVSKTTNVIADRSRVYLSQLSAFRVKKSISYFDRRVTCIEWHPHPQFPTVVALASKGGDLIWYDTSKSPMHKGYTGELVKENDDQETLPYLYGVGAGGSITAVCPRSQKYC